MDRDRLLQSLKRHEGLRLRPYSCPAGKLTIGYGHNLTDVPISQRAADVILEDDVAAAVSGVNEALPWAMGLDDVRYRTLVEMAYNLGMTALLKFKATLEAARDRRWDDAARQMLASRWAEQVGKKPGQRADVLARRMRTGQDEESTQNGHD